MSTLTLDLGRVTFDLSPPPPLPALRSPWSAMDSTVSVERLVVGGWSPEAAADLVRIHQELQQ